MSYLKINDPEKRDSLVKSFLERRKKIHERNLAEKIGEIELESDIAKFFKPVTEAQKKSWEEIKKGLKPIEDEIKGLREYVRLPNYPGIDLFSSEDGEKSIKKGDEKINIGPLAFSYFMRYGSAEKEKLDKSYGLYTENNKFYIGNKEVKFKDDDFEINNKTYKGTEGLWELITSKNPIKEKITDDDMKNYRKILMTSDAVYRGNDPTNKNPKSVNTDKWRKIIKPVWAEIKRRKKITGTGTIIIPSDPNALIKRLDLLLKSKAAGNTGVRNELVSLCDELKRQGYLDAKNYKKIMSIL